MNAAASRRREGTGYRNLVLVLLTAVTVMNFVDRQLIGILSPAIKADLQLSDTQLGLLKGIVFALFYRLLGVPIARLADRWNRISIVSLSLLTWSGFTALSGMAGNFTQLALARIGVGIGEAGGTAPIHSVISDYFPKQKRAMALAIIGMGVPLGAGLSFLLGGWLLQTYGWRTAFVAMGIPGIALALVVRLVVREPLRGAQDFDPPGRAEGRAAKTAMSVADAFRHLIAIPSWRAIVVGAAAATFSSAATGAWIVDLFARAHPAVSLNLVLIVLGLSVGVGFTIGTFLGGWLVDRLSVRNKAAYGLVPAIGLAINVPATLLWIWLDAPYLALAVQAIGASTVGVYFGPSFALVQSLAPLGIRATSTALFFLVANLFGLGLGPTLVGALSEFASPLYGEVDALRIGLTMVTLASAGGAWAFWRMSRHIAEDWKLTGDQSDLIQNTQLETRNTLPPTFV